MTGATAAIAAHTRTATEDIMAKAADITISITPATRAPFIIHPGRPITTTRALPTAIANHIPITGAAMRGGIKAMRGGTFISSTSGKAGGKTFATSPRW